ncbi:AAA family ATPase [Perlucidibaca aquatica]|uniref:AAA family ATPase n=1 Tax=Perlucidibaca aquatica TaxID=1852776 RepID=UPI00083B1C86|nr:ATP-binding protein [Perlucidibaca aquatica]
MLLRFGVQNHGSLASYQELKMTATALKDVEDGVFHVGADGADSKVLRVLPVAGIYGANASGKSTLLSGFEFFCNGIVESHTGIASGIGTPFVPFKLDEESRKKTSQYDADIVLDNVRYHYGYTLDGKKIVNEWLYSFDLKATRQVRTVLFMRETSDELAVELQFGKSLKGENKQISKLVRPNSLFLSAAAQNAHPQLTPIFEFFYKRVVQRLYSGIEENKIPEQLSTYFGSDSARRTAAVQFLRAADVGISGMDFSKTPIGEKESLLMQDFEQVLRKHLPSNESFPLIEKKERAKVSLLHLGAEGKTYPLPLKRESTGTLALLQLLGPAFARLHDGGVLVVDELNSALHPLVSRELIRLFSSPTTNPSRAQLIFTTHDTNLLSGGLLRRDQIWFTEKDPIGATHVYALSDIKVRANDNLERGYLMGRFGAIPFVGCGLTDFADLFQKEIQGGEK